MNAGWKKIQYRNTVKHGKIVEVSLSYNLSPKRPLKCSDSKYFFQVMAITDPNDGKLSEIFHFLLIGFCFYRFPGGPQLVIEQLEQIRNLSAATDNSITSDQKMEARKKVRIFYEMENISRFFWKIIGPQFQPVEIRQQEKRPRQS